ncbi:2-C-methyl-D-erythritol 2,4-cyclodiphosphate synthase [Plantactinospora sp. DSM 117369]
MFVVPRIGIGIDVHAFNGERPCWVGGLRWEGVPGLDGHTDADVAAHAACDALLSASGLGDVGSVYGVDDPDWANASGRRVLADTALRVRNAGFEIGNVAVQVVGSTPKIAPRRNEAERVLSEAVEADVRITGTTTDGLGFLGRDEGLAAIATALIYRATP